MSYPAIYRFVDRVRGVSPTARDFSMSVADAKALHSEVTKLLLTLEEVRDSENKSNTDSTATFNIGEKVELKGGSF